MSEPRILRLLWLAMVAVTATTCRDSTAPPSAVATVTIAPSVVTLPIHGTRSLTATIKDAAGRVLTDRAVTWTSSNTSVATISATGLATGIAQGSAIISAVVEGRSATATITVPAASVAAVAVTSWWGGDSAQVVADTTHLGWTILTATPLDSAGAPLAGGSVTWTSSNTGVARVDTGGVVRGVAPGWATITATSEGVAGTAAVRVLLPIASVTIDPVRATLAIGDTVRPVVTARDGAGNIVADVDGLCPGYPYISGTHPHMGRCVEWRVFSAHGGDADSAFLAMTRLSPYTALVTAAQADSGEVVAVYVTATAGYGYGDIRQGAGAKLLVISARVTDLGTLGGRWSRAAAVNDFDQVVGASATATGASHAFLWTSGGGMRDLGTLGGHSSGAAAISNGGTVVGWSETTDGGEYHAFRWTETGGMQDLGTGAASGVNAGGDVVGYAGANAVAVVWTASGDRQTLPLLPGTYQSAALAINDVGEVVGIAWEPGCAECYDDVPHAFRWTVAKGMEDLFPNTASEAYAINEAGQVVGGVSQGGVGGGAYRWAAGNVQLLGTGSFSGASGINRDGDVVGASPFDIDRGGLAFLWTDATGMLVLGAVPGTSTEARAINDHGVIVGTWGERARMWTF